MRTKYARPQPHPLDAGVHRFLGLGELAARTKIDRRHLYRALGASSQHIWVPAPDVIVGRRPGWSLPCVDHWWRHDYQPFDRPPTMLFADTATMNRAYGTRWESLWQRISDGSISAPVVWVDNDPGWIPPHAPKFGSR
ncbi:hypothetical protein [Nocardia wallacei]|uniref:hypothetical protein n=1 Tax=Nocardia wallacei TaxID=480035 RepID=UPI0024542799|nr:hypothetical protein [Nocardia wallacei]